MFGIKKYSTLYIFTPSNTTTRFTKNNFVKREDKNPYYDKYCH